MNKHFSAALRRAATLTRAGSLGEATRAIQDALRGTEGRPNADFQEPASENPPGLTLELKANDTSATAFSQSAPGKSEATDIDATRRRAASIRPLADTVRELTAGHRLFDGLPPGLRTSAPTPTVPDGAQYESRVYSSPEGQRAYRLYVPSTTTRGITGIVLMLHGCKQDADDFAVGTRMNDRAGAAGMIVIYPTQPSTANPSACWSWFNPKDQKRGGGEPAILAGLARSVGEEFGVSPDCVYVAGLSAGGAMSAILAEIYPDVFAAAGVHSGLPHGAAHDIPSAFAAMGGKRGGAWPATTSGTRLIVFHGTADGVVHPSNAEAIVAPRRSLAASVEVHRNQIDTGRGFERVVYRSADGLPIVERWLLDGQGHSWSGGDPTGSYTDASGPDASAEMIRFFQESIASGEQ